MSEHSEFSEDCFADGGSRLGVPWFRDVEVEGEEGGIVVVLSKPPTP